MTTTALPPEWERALAKLWPEPSPWLNDPAGWVGERTGEHVWSVQRRIMASVREHRRTAIPSAHGVGKSWSAARIACWWLDAHPPGEGFVVTTAPTDSQVKAILWREITRAHRKGDLPGRVTMDAQWKISDELVAFGRKPADIAGDADQTTVTAFQGIHARFVLVIFDEAAGIPKPLWTAATSLLTNADARFLAIGNPDDPSSEFAAVCAGADPEQGGISARGWNVLPISVFHTPNFTGEAVPDQLRPYLPSSEWLEDFTGDVAGAAGLDELAELVEARTAGDERPVVDVLGDSSALMSTPLWVSKALGRFPEDAAAGVIPWSFLNRCRNGQAHANELMVPVELGVDVGASDNGDWTVVRERKGMHAGRRWAVRSADPERVADEVVKAARESGAGRIKLDVIGVGWALQSLLRRDLPGVEVVGVNVAEAAEPGADGTQFANLRAAVWWEVGRKLSADGAWDLDGLDDRTLADLAAPRWSEDRAGRVVVESKDDVRKRLGRSPDDADALLLAFYAGQWRKAEQGRYENRTRRGRR